MTTSLIVATGIANVFQRDALAAASAAWTIGELFDGRFMLGLGVGHRPSNLRWGRLYERPLSHMRAYLETLPQAPYTAARARCRVPVVIGALLPGMLRLAAASADGALTYFASPEHTRLARSIIGPDKKLCVTQALILEEDAAKAESAARAYVNHYLRLPNYQRQMKLVGFSEADFASGASDRLVRAIVAWGKAAQLQERIAAHYAAGATHVCILALRTGVSEKPGEWLPDKRCLEALAP